MRGGRAARLLGAAVLTLALLAAGEGLAGGSAAHAARTPERAFAADPLAGWKLFRFANTPAAAAAAGFRARWMTRDAELMERISSQPTAAWLTQDSSRVLRQVRNTTKLASRQGAAAVLVAYDIPGRGCGENAGASESRYLRWIAEMAQGIGSRHTIVILEPDAIPFAAAGCAISPRLLGRAVQTLMQASGARVYIDAGNPSWITPPSRLVAPLLEADIRQAAGFSLNVANFLTTAANVAYGDELSRLLGGAHFVIDTGRNGNGPELNAGGAVVICNPPGRALGAEPTTNTGMPGVDAYLWVLPPASSDAGCRAGGSRSEGSWTRYALELAENASGS
jgi:endoglucanase